MRNRALLLAAVFALSTLDGVAEERQIVDVKELAGSWRGGSPKWRETNGPR